MNDTEYVRRWEMTTFTEAEYLNAKAMVDVLNEYYSSGHIVGINAAVFTNRVGAHIYGEGVWLEMWKRMKSESKLVVDAKGGDRE